MIDPFGRHVTYLRVSVTDRCDFRCVYCMAEDMTFLPKKDLLSFEEIEAIATACPDHGLIPSTRTSAEKSSAESGTSSSHQMPLNHRSGPDTVIVKCASSGSSARSVHRSQ